MADDCIRREDVLERIDGIWDCADMVFEPNDHCCNMDDCSSCKWSETKDAIRRIVEHTPAADVRPVVHGEWEFEYENLDEQIEYCCTVCDWIGVNANKYKFCPNCGAMMDGEGVV